MSINIKMIHKHIIKILYYIYNYCENFYLLLNFYKNIVYDLNNYYLILRKTIKG